MSEKLIVLRVDEEIAEDVSRLIASALSLNGYRHNNPSVPDAQDESYAFVEQLEAAQQVIGAIRYCQDRHLSCERCLQVKSAVDLYLEKCPDE